MAEAEASGNAVSSGKHIGVWEGRQAIYEDTVLPLETGERVRVLSTLEYAC